VSRAGAKSPVYDAMSLASEFAASMPQNLPKPPAQMTALRRKRKARTADDPAPVEALPRSAVKPFVHLEPPAPVDGNNRRTYKDHTRIKYILCTGDTHDRPHSGCCFAGGCKLFHRCRRDLDRRALRNILRNEPHSFRQAERCPLVWIGSFVESTNGRMGSVVTQGVAVRLRSGAGRARSSSRSGRSACRTENVLE
jgi:hypothetical protein